MAIVEDISKDDWLNFKIDGNTEEIIKNTVVPILTNDENRKCYNKGIHFGRYDGHIRVWSRGELEKLEWLYKIFEKECNKHGYGIEEKEVIDSKDTEKKPDRNRPEYSDPKVGEVRWQYHIMLVELGSECALNYYKKFDNEKIRPEIIWEVVHFFLNNISYTYPDEIIISELISCNAKIGLMEKQV